MSPMPAYLPKISILITAGPTRERIDPVRFISNYSTGTFGYELAREAARRRADVVLISGPVDLEPLKGVKLVRCESAADMRRAVLKEFKKADAVIMASAVSDWRVKTAAKKLKKRQGRQFLELIENPDILKEVGRIKGKRLTVGFALETENLEKNAVKKLREKNLDLIVANRLTKNKNVFGCGVFDLLLIDKSGNKVKIRRKTKKEAAKIILDKLFSLTIY